MIWGELEQSKEEQSFKTFECCFLSFQAHFDASFSHCVHAHIVAATFSLTL